MCINPPFYEKNQLYMIINVYRLSKPHGGRYIQMFFQLDSITCPCFPPPASYQPATPFIWHLGHPGGLPPPATNLGCIDTGDRWIHSVLLALCEGNISINHAASGKLLFILSMDYLVECFVRSRGVSTLWGLGYRFADRCAICQASRQHCCRAAWQIAKRYKNANMHHVASRFYGCYDKMPYCLMNRDPDWWLLIYYRQHVTKYGMPYCRTLIVITCYSTTCLSFTNDSWFILWCTAKHCLKSQWFHCRILH